MFLVLREEEFEAFSKGFLQQKSKLSLNYNKLVVRKEIKSAIIIISIVRKVF